MSYPKVQITKTKVQKMGDELPLKCKNYTLEEVAALRIMQKKPSATQKEIAAEIRKSERTVKGITMNLQEKKIYNVRTASEMVIGELLRINK